MLRHGVGAATCRHGRCWKLLGVAGSSHGRAAEEEEEEEQEEEEESLPEDPELVAQDALRQESEDLTCTVDNNTCSAMI